MAVVGIVYILLAVAIPTAIIALKWKFSRKLSWISPLILSYILGIALGQVGLSESDFNTIDFASQVAVGLSIPLLLFSANVVAVWKSGLIVALCMLCGAFAVALSAFLSFLMFRDSLEKAHEVAGMMVGVFTGGTQNMAAVRVALGIDANLFVATHTAEIGVGALYILALMTVAKKALSKCMKPYRRVAGHAEADNGSVAIELREYEGDPGETVTADGDQVGLTQNPTLRKESADGSTNSGNEQEGNVVASTTPRESLSEGESYGSGVPAEPSFEKDSAKRFTRMLERGQRLRLLGCFFLAVVVLGAGFGLSQLVPENNRTLVLILFITTCSLLLSFIPAVRNVRDTFTLGEYIILIFFTAVGMLADVRKFGDTNPLLFAMVAVIAVLGVGLHFVLAAIFRFDVDTFIISSVCNVLSPPFVGMAAIAIDNKELVVPGVTAGIIGYAVGNYIGIGIAYLCEAI